MKKLIYISFILALFTNCEDVIDVDLNNVEPKLVIEASINYFKNTTGNEQTIKLTLSAPFFDNTIPPATSAIVQVFDSFGNTFNFTEIDSTGIYSNNTFIPNIGTDYTLVISYDNEIYTATETLTSVVPIESVEQNNEGGFSGEDIELKAYYTDPEGISNYYFFEFISDIPVVPTLSVYDDTFTDGNEIFGFYTEEDLEAGDIVTIRNYGVSSQFYDYMFILLQQSGDSGGGPFETQPATVRGNCINTTYPDNFPYGYFRLSEVDELIYTVQ